MSTYQGTRDAEGRDCCPGCGMWFCDTLCGPGPEYDEDGDVIHAWGFDG